MPDGSLTAAPPLAGSSGMADASLSPDALAKRAKDTTAKMEGAYKEYVSDVDRIEAGRRKMEGVYDTERQQLGPPPRPTPIPQPQVHQTSPQQAWSSAAMVIAALGSLFTRHPMMTAMNAAASALTAFHKGDMDAANLAFKQWEVANKNAMEMANYELDSYKAIMADIDRREAQSGREADAAIRADTAKFRALAESFRNENIATALAANDYNRARQLVIAQKRAVDAATRAGAANTKSFLLLSGMKEWEAEFQRDNGRPPSPIEQVKKYGELSKELGGAGQLTTNQAAQLENKAKADLTKKGTLGEQYFVDKKAQSLYDAALAVHPDAKGIVAQTTLLDLYVRKINGNMALRNFQVQILQRHQGFLDRVNSGITNYLHGGVLSEDMKRDIIETARDYDLMIARQFGAQITAAQWTAHKTPGMDPLKVVPAGFDPPPHPKNFDSLSKAQKDTAIARLKASDDPTTWANFDEVFGQGAAARVMRHENVGPSDETADTGAL